MTRKYEFNWKILGDIATGRPNLGLKANVEVYRLMQYCFRDILEKNFGTEKADELFFESGHLAGMEFYKNIIKESSSFNDFIKTLQAVMVEKGIGILRMEEVDLEQGKFIISIFEDLDCSGLPELDYEFCQYDEGFIAGLLEAFTGHEFSVKEIDCWCTGDRACRFVATMIKK